MTNHSLTIKPMLNKTQKDLVLSELRVNGFITRNFCLSRYISRLGAIICDLKKEGYDIEASWVKTEYGKDYVYKLKPRQGGLF